MVIKNFCIFAVLNTKIILITKNNKEDKHKNGAVIEFLSD